MSEQGQQLLRLLFAIRLLPQQAVEELHGDGTQFAEVLPQEPFALPGIVDGMMTLERLLHAGLRAGHEPMTGDFLQADRVDDDLAVGDTDGEHLADVRPGDRVQVEPMRDEALDVDVAIDDQGGVKVAGGQRQEVWLFALMALQRRFLEVAQAAHVGDAGEPPSRHLVEMLQRVERPAIEQASLGIKELSLHFSFRLGPANAAGLRSKTVMGGEGQGLGIVENAVGIMAEHDRLEIVVETDAGGGLAICDPLGAQYLLAPDTLDRKIVESFQNSAEKTVRQLRHVAYTFQTLVYENKGKRSLKEQVDAILHAVSGEEPISGHGILVLPENADDDLHNYIKKRLHNRIQFQCVSASKVKRFFHMEPDNGEARYFVPADLERDFTSYLRHTAMGLLLVNRQWPWILEKKTHYDAYIGVDVLRNTVAFTFFYEGGRRCFERLEESKQKEKVPRRKMASVIYRYLKEDLQDRRGTLRSLVFRRDGRAFSDEWFGFMDAIKRLIDEGFLPQDIRVGMVEVHKTISLGLRLLAEEEHGRFVNPRIGSWRELNDREGLLCTTGYPFNFWRHGETALHSRREGRA